jgi:arylsulfatase A-like enzyme/Flp pilus assembly protein TadD
VLRETEPDRVQRPGRIEPERAPNVLLISVDTLRADYIGAYGGRRKTSTIDGLAEKGVLFEKAVSHVPITLPSHASLLTGTYPIAHGVRDNGSFRLSEERETLAEILQSAGYRTAAFVGSFALDSRFGLDQGFDVYDDFYGDTSSFNDFAISERPADAVLEPALSWLENEAGSRWFAFVHLYDPHAPYVPPARFRESSAGDPYASEVAYVDEALGRFLEKLRAQGLLEETLIVLTADHGEGLGEHGEKTHGMFAYESTLHVPLIMAWEGVLPRGLRVSSRVRLVDVAPSVAELARLPRIESHQGQSLVPLMEAPSRGEDRESYFEALSFHLNRNWAPLTGLYRGQHKYIELPLPELYDLSADPEETRNLLEESPESSREIAASLATLVAEHSAEGSEEVRAAEVDRETVERLRSLGYVVAPRESRPPRKYTRDDDPKRLVPLSDRLDAGVAAHLAGRTEEAVRLFRSILDERPTFANAYANLAYVLRETGRLEEAISVIEKAIERGVETRSLLGRLGLYLQEAGRLPESVAILETLTGEDPTYVEAYNYLGVSYAHLGQPGKAIAALSRVIELDPSYASAYSNLGSVYLSLKRYENAERELRRALELDARLPTAWNGLGVVYGSTGREAEAISAWKRSVDLDHRQYDTLYNLGTLLTRLHRFDEAIPYLEQFATTAPPERYGEDILKVKRLVSELKARG